MLDLKLQSELFPRIWSFPLISFLFAEKGSLGKGLDAPELEMHQVAPESLNIEF